MGTGHPESSPGVWYLEPLPLRGYALSIILGIVVAVWIGERRWVGRGGRRRDIADLALWAVQIGIRHRVAPRARRRPEGDRSRIRLWSRSA
ncbi:prolipoprotein diacylglyceryl transferase family protein [Arsenicicoccus bolidensis]|uniref:Prolipoprotein diacylglyceryl transferase n=1 Tax=Arsenicicoccus bolidensis TaxID=229480 RepID=A0ABS9Q3A7_9MICO|nr:prolipoprotein diacylglyceryl transferase family protein [Arsenicicoccus bolidensis]MCG7322367.1 prolipoprotein diacylglyceryl transferase [Arsenicicoccus bolidensis]